MKQGVKVMRKMYKEDRQMSHAKAEEAFAAGNHGILAVNGDEGYPYAVPVNYIYEDGKIYIHSAKYGYKIDAIQKNNKACFTAILNSKIVQNKVTAAFQSVIATGTIEIVEDEEIRRHVLEQFIYKMTPDFIEGGMKFVNGAIGKTAILCINVEELKGKENMAESFDV